MREKFNEQCECFKSGGQGEWFEEQGKSFFQLEGAKCNPLAMNARVRATTGEMGEVLSSGSYLSQHDLRIQFGLGNHDRVDRAEILRPNGNKETLSNLCADRYLCCARGSKECLK